MRGHSYFEKVLQNAENQLKRKADGTPDGLLDLYRRFLKIEDHRLKMAHLAGENGWPLAQKRSELVSIILRHLWEEVWGEKLNLPATEFRSALVAVGGFGRNELNPYSDIDILFLYTKKKNERSTVIDEVISQILYTLWDVGLKVGHASRTIEEVVTAAREDLRTKTSLLEARFLCGDENLFKELLKVFDERCLRGREQEYIDWRFRDQSERHTKNGGTVFLQEPHLKNGCGGLRDYHNLLWVARVKNNLTSTADLQEHGLITSSERKQLDSAYDFLLHLRTELHYLQKGNGDILTLRHQGSIATNFHYPGNTILLRTEAMMREYYHHANNLFLLTESITQEIAGTQKKKNTPWSFFPLPANKRVKTDLFTIQNGKISAQSPGIFKSDPLRLLRLFQLAQQYNAEPDAELNLLIRRNLPLVNRLFIQQKGCRELLLSLFTHKGQVGRIFRRMHEVGLLGRLIPEFAPLTCLVQHEFFHRYTADEHTLRCLEMLDRIVDSTEPPFNKYREILKKVETPHLLYLAMLLHDTGKAANTRHHSEVSAANALKAAQRLRLSSEERDLLVFLVDHHMTISETTRRKNLDEEQSILDFARFVGTQERLDFLMLIGFADIQGTDAMQSASDWKELLFWQLYRRTSQVLSNKEEFVLAAEKSREAFQSRLAQTMEDEIDQSEIEAHFRNLPPRYFKTISENLVSAHIRNVHRFFFNQLMTSNPLFPVIQWRDRSKQGHSEVIIVTWDRQRLFSKLAGAFAASDLVILNAEIFTRYDDIVIDTFRVATERLTAVTEERDKKLFADILNQALTISDYEFKQIAKAKAKRSPGYEGADFPTKISFDQISSKEYTLLDIQTPDQHGLLYRTATCIADHGYDIAYARITTEKGAAFNTFYLCDQLGKKIESGEAVQSLTADLQKRLNL